MRLSSLFPNKRHCRQAIHSVRRCRPFTVSVTKPFPILTFPVNCPIWKETTDLW